MEPFVIHTADTTDLAQTQALEAREASPKFRFPLEGQTEFESMIGASSPSAVWLTVCGVS